MVVDPTVDYDIHNSKLNNVNLDTSTPNSSKSQASGTCLIELQIALTEALPPGHRTSFTSTPVSSPSGTNGTTVAECQDFTITKAKNTQPRAVESQAAYDYAPICTASDCGSARERYKVNNSKDVFILKMNYCCSLCAHVFKQNGRLDTMFRLKGSESSKSQG